MMSGHGHHVPASNLSLILPLTTKHNQFLKPNKDNSFELFDIWLFSNTSKSSNSEINLNLNF